MTALIGLFGGVMLGLAARLGRFCTLGAIEDALYGQDLRRIRMWAIALAVAISGVFASDAFGLIAIDQSIYASQAWNPLASIVGGLVFGYGMGIAGNCGYGALARCAGGDLRSLVVVIVMGISAYMVMGGPIAELRLWAFPGEQAGGNLVSFGLAHSVAGLTGIPAYVPAFLIATALIVWALASPDVRPGAKQVTWSIVVGIAIISGWLGTSWVAKTSFDVVQVGSHSFTAPVGESLLYLMTSSGGGMNFAIGSVAGVLVGAFIGCVWRREFRWEACDDPRELGRQMFGAFLMGLGGVLALGCSVGQGLTAFSTLAYSAPVVLLAIAGGAALGLRHLIQGYHPA